MVEQNKERLSAEVSRFLCVAPKKVLGTKAFNMAWAAIDAQGLPCPDYEGVVTIDLYEGSLGAEDVKIGVGLTPPATCQFAQGRLTIAVRVTKDGTTRLSCDDEFNQINGVSDLITIG